MAYKITATIHKNECEPVQWTHYSDSKLTAKQCIEMLSKKSADSWGRKKKDGVQLQDFECVRV